MQVQIETYTPVLKHFVEQVIDNLRPSDRYEASAVGIDRIPSDLADVSMPHAFVAFIKAEPVFVFGATTLVPGLLQLWGFGTNKTLRILPALTRFLLQRRPALFSEQGIRRIQVSVPLQSQQSFTWLSGALGMRIETVMPEYCADGTPMVQLVYTRQDYQEYVSSRGETPSGENASTGN